jgi:hypothetical protein
MTPEVEDIAKDDDEGFRQAEIERQEREHRHSITAIHEAAHAVAFFMTAKLMGYDSADALWYVEMYQPHNPEYFGRNGMGCTLATTYGPMFSKAINDAAKDVDAHEGMPTQEYCADVIAAARAAGADIESWVRATVLIGMAGPVAQAKETGRSLDDMSDEMLAILKTDWTGPYTFGSMAGMSPGEIQVIVDNAIAYVSMKFDESDLWNALLALAKALPKEGRMDGRECWKIFSDAIETFEPWV